MSGAWHCPAGSVAIGLTGFGHIMECLFLPFSNCTVNDGKGVPVFTGEVDCTYFFTWDTKYACVKEKEDLLCSVTDGKKRYDLSALARHSGRTRAPRGPPSASIRLVTGTFSCLFPYENLWKCSYLS